MIGGFRRGAGHERAGPSLGDGMKGSDDGRVHAYGMHEWPLALLFPADRLANGSGVAAPDDPLGAILRAVPLATLIEAKTAGPHAAPSPEPVMHALLFRGMQFLVRLRTADQTDHRFHDAHCLMLDTGCAGHASLEITAGQHIIAARHSAPVMAAMLELALSLIAPLQASIIGWGPADQIMPAPYFIRSVTPFTTGGPWPLLALVQMHQNQAHQWQTLGLDWLFGQNVMLDVPPGFDRLQALDRLIDLARDIAENGPIEEQGVIPGKAMGEQLRLTLRPRVDGRRDVHAQLRIGPVP